MIKKYLVKWKKNGIYHNAVWEGKNKRDVRQQLSWENITSTHIISIEEIKEDDD